MKNVMKKEDKFLKNEEIRSDLLANPPSKWLSLTEILPEKFAFKINDGICQLIDCIYEFQFLVKIQPTPDYEYIFDSKTLEVQKFLVHLLRKKVISNLQLPLSIKFSKKNAQQGTISIESRSSSYIEDGGALADAMLKPKEFNRKIIGFKITNWNSFSKIKNKIKNSKRYKEYLKNKELRNSEKKKRKLQILNLEETLRQKALQQENKKGGIKEVNPQKYISKEISFYPETSILEFRGKHIEISKTRNSDPHYLLTILFRDKNKVWAYDEIWEDPLFRLPNQEYDPKNDWRKIYNAGYSVNEKIAKATTINDFLNITKTEISINKKYLR